MSVAAQSSTLTTDEVARQRFAGVRLDERLCLLSPPEARSLALAVVLETSRVVVRSAPDAGPYHLSLSLEADGLLLHLSDLGGNGLEEVVLSFKQDSMPILASVVELDDETARNLGQLFTVLQNFS